MNLYLVVLGGKVPGGHVEMHDVRWVIGKTIESTLPQLKSEWIGSLKGLHVDSYKLIKFVDGYQVTLEDEHIPYKITDNKLWFVNMGGYKQNDMLEHHHFELVVAPSAQKAKQKALAKWTELINQIHQDDNAKIIKLKDYTILLKPDPYCRDEGMEPDWNGYWVIS